MSCQRTCCCAVCGLRFSDLTQARYHPEDGDLQPQPWLQKAIIMSDWQDRMPGGSNACESLAESTLGETTSHDGIHMIEEAPAINHERRRPYSAFFPRQYGQIDGTYNSPLMGTSTLHFPVHAACLSLAKRLIEASAKIQSNTPYGGPKSMRQLWDILLSRFWNGSYSTIIQGQGLIRRLRDPHNHYLVKNSLLDAYPKHNSAFADPINVSGVTEYVLSLLRPVPEQKNNSPEQGISTYMALIAPEMRLAIIDSLFPLRNLPLQCTRLLDQSYWKEILISGCLLPFLWDLDLDLIKAKESQQPGEREWDWERLVRQLSQSGFIDYSAKAAQAFHHLHPVPFGLRNRRRIFRILEEMELGDIKRLPDIYAALPQAQPANS